MAYVIGGVLGLASLLYSILLVLNGWHGMSLSLRVYVLFVPSIFVTIGALALLSSARILAVRLYHRVRGTQAKNEDAFMDGDGWNWVVFLIWITAGIGLYGILQKFFG